MKHCCFREGEAPAEPTWAPRASSPSPIFARAQVSLPKIPHSCDTTGCIVAGRVADFDWPPIGDTLTAIYLFVRYRSESTPEYERINFGHTFQASTVIDVPHPIGQLLGRKICLKGYAFPGRRRTGITEFLMTPDGYTQIADRLVLVQLRPEDRLTFTPAPVAVSGTLMLNPNYSETKLGPKYLLTDATVRVSRTPFGLLAKVRLGC